MAGISHLGFFPFCIKELAEDGEPFEEWDQSTVVDENMPSKTSDEPVTVYGSGTEYFIGLTLDELMYLFWKPKQLKLVFEGQYELSLPEISVVDGYWDDSDPPQWIEVPRTADAIDMTVAYPDDATTTTDTWNSPAATEKDLVCELKSPNSDDPIWPQFGLYLEKTETTFDEDAVENAVNGIIFFASVDSFFLGGKGVIKGSDGLYYPSTAAPSEDPTWFSYGASIVHYGYNATPATYPDADIDVVYPFNVGNLAGFTYQIPASVDITTLSEKELKFHIEFPSGRKTFTTKLWGSETEDIPLESPVPEDETEDIPSPVPNIELVLSFEETWQYAP
jgi:hypothetical protein